MIKIRVAPVRGVMAIRTLPAEVVRGFITGMAGYTIGRTRCAMIEAGTPPGGGTVTGRALPAEMVRRFIT
jgi:hypothetical protein